MAKAQKTPQQKAAETRKANAAKEAAAAQKQDQAAAQGVPAGADDPMGTLPLVALLCGAHARRKSWAKGVTVFVGVAGGRGGKKQALMVTGSRTGSLPYRIQDPDHSDLLATDWEVIEVAAD